MAIDPLHKISILNENIVITAGHIKKFAARLERGSRCKLQKVVAFWVLLRGTAVRCTLLFTNEAAPVFSIRVVVPETKEG